MSTYLLTWNPRKSEEPHLETLAQAFEAGVELKEEGRWSCGRRRSIRIGDRVFLLRQGSQDPGLVGSGWVTRPSFCAPSWDPDKRADGVEAYYVEVAWDAMTLPEKGLPREALLRGLLSASLVNSQAGGVLVEAEAAGRLEQEWARHLNRGTNISGLIASGEGRLEGQPVELRTLRRMRDHLLRREALDLSEGVCEVCKVDFSRVLEGRGVRVLQVHHRRQLAMLKVPRINTVRDLAVVCANCHALIHADPRNAVSVEELRRRLGAIGYAGSRKR